MLGNVEALKHGTLLVEDLSFMEQRIKVTESMEKEVDLNAQALT